MSSVGYGYSKIVINSKVPLASSILKNLKIFEKICQKIKKFTQRGVSSNFNNNWNHHYTYIHITQVSLQIFKP